MNANKNTNEPKLFSWHGRPREINSSQPGGAADANGRLFGGLCGVSAASGWMLSLPSTITQRLLGLPVPKIHWHEPLEIGLLLQGSGFSRGGTWKRLGEERARPRPPSPTTHPPQGKEVNAILSVVQ